MNYNITPSLLNKEFITVVPQVNPVIIEDIMDYTVEKLASFIHHLKMRIQQFETILSCMKIDCQELYDSLRITTTSIFRFDGNVNI